MRKIHLFQIITIFLVLVPNFSFACQSPTGVWKAQDKYGEMKLVFEDDGTGLFYPDTSSDEKEIIAWKFISTLKRKTTKTQLDKETNVLEVQFVPPDGTVEFMLCTGEKLVGLLFDGEEYYSYTYTRNDKGFVSNPINAELAKTESASTYQRIDKKIAELNRHYASKMANMANLSEYERALMQTNMVREGKKITTYFTLTTLTRDEINSKKPGWLQDLKDLTERDMCKSQTIDDQDWFYRPDFTHETVFTSSDGHAFLTASVGPFECYIGKP